MSGGFNILGANSLVKSGLKLGKIDSKILTGITNTIDSAVKMTVDTVKNVGSRAFSAIKNGIVNVYNGAKNALVNVYNGAKNALVNIYNGTKNAVVNVYNGTKDALVSGVGHLKNYVSAGYNKVKSLFIKHNDDIEKPFTKSNLKLGQEMHKAYKADLVDNTKKFKEFSLPSGKRIDYIDFDTKTIYELKPYNPRQIKAGTKQLEGYLKEVEEEFGEVWKTVLDAY